ncbi:MAG: pseudouridine synthase [Porticoccus sp.]|nr:pseudouridine synthase [Porticoccus sp.]
MRLDKLISNASDYSRTQVKKLVKEKRVKVNGEVTTNPATLILETAKVCLDDAPIALPGPRYFMLNKPENVVSATKDSEHTTAIDLIHEPRPEQLQIAGRLDLDTTGLVLITDNGQWNHSITSPRSNCRKTYDIKVSEPLTSDLIKKFYDGIWLDGEKRRCLPADLKILDDHHALLTISEGKYHQVKRMFTALGNHVTQLHRLKIGGITLDPALEFGCYRPLTQQEIKSI